MDPDVLIVGAGPSGAVAAKRLAEEGFRVVVLEQGDWPDYSKAHGHPRGLPAHRRPRLGLGSERAPRAGRLPDRRLRVRHHGADVERRRRRDDRLRGAVAAQHAVGLPRAHARRRRRRLAADLRGPRAVLRARRARLRRLGAGGDTAFPPGEGPPLPPVPLGPAGRRVARAHNELGWHWWPAPLAIATRKYGALNPCVQRGTCLWACADGAKCTVDRTHWPRAIELGVELRTRARVQRADGAAGRARRRRGVRRRRRRRARGPRRRDDPVRERHRHAAAAAACRADGLANSSGLVGKRLMMHPFGDRRRRVRRGLPRVAGAVGPVHPLARVLRDRRVARIRARREVGPAADRRPVLDDQRVSRGARRTRSGARASRTRCAGGSGTRRCGG